MSIELPGAYGQGELACTYHGSRLRVRGPARELSEPYTAFLGSGETFGRFVERPFVDVVERIVGAPCLNLGCVNAGVDTFLHDDAALAMAARAERVVLQVMGAPDLSNDFYRVHPRRNDRFLEPTDHLRDLCPGLDFAEINFNGHLLATLVRRYPSVWRTVREALRQTWVARMKMLADRIGQPPVLLWLRYPHRGEAGQTGLGPSPALVDTDLVEGVRGVVCAVVELRVEPADTAGETHRLVNVGGATVAAGRLIGPRMHTRVAEALVSGVNW